MKKKLVTGVSALALLAFVGTAEPAKAGGEFAGFYVGGHAGYGDADFSGIFDSTDAGETLNDLDVDGFVGGVHAGFNYMLGDTAGMFNGLLVGLEVDASFAGMSDRVNVDFGNPDTFQAEIDVLASVRGRVGVVVDQFLLFATGGVAFVNGTYTAFDDAPPTQQSREFTEVGGVVGGGIEFGGFDIMNIRIEALYYIFDARDSNFNNFAGTGEVADFAKLNDAFVIRAGVSIPLDRFFGGAN